MRTANWIALVAIVSTGMGPAIASDDDCEFRAERKAGIDAAGVTKIVLRTGAGDRVRWDDKVWLSWDSSSPVVVTQ